ncbi:MAG: class I SAM-dependent RNA methyltransferase [Oligoflexales bacterium]|nr:class I SAM-dependent RNA methyltransferase [Oligoflexales bacterium]
MHQNRTNRSIDLPNGSTRSNIHFVKKDQAQTFGRLPRRAAPVDELSCYIKRLCQSCLFINDPYEKSLLQKYEQDLHSLRSELPLLGIFLPKKPQAAPRPLQYRTTFKLAVREARTRNKTEEAEGGRKIAIGLFEPDSHRIVDISSCPIHVPILQKLIHLLKSELEKENTMRPWKERISPKGDEPKSEEGEKTPELRYVVAKSCHISGDTSLLFVVTDPSAKTSLLPMIRSLRRQGVRITSAAMNINTSTGNAILGETTLPLLEPALLKTSLAGFSLQFSPTSFMQVNPWQAEQIYNRISQLAGISRTSSEPVTAWDLYCGVGIISMILAQNGYKVLGMEENSAAIQDAHENREKNQITRHSLHFMSARVEDSFDSIPVWAQKPKLIVMNPSRRGLHESVREKLKALAAGPDLEQIIYVSCDVKTFARDLKSLTESSCLKLRQLEAYDMFAQTDKLEWLAILNVCHEGRP